MMFISCFPLIVNVHNLAQAQLSAVYVCVVWLVRTSGSVGKVREDSKSYKTPASQPIRVKALVDSQ